MKNLIKIYDMVHGLFCDNLKCCHVMWSDDVIRVFILYLDQWKQLFNQLSRISRINWMLEWDLWNLIYRKVVDRNLCVWVWEFEYIFGKRENIFYLLSNVKGSVIIASSCFGKERTISDRNRLREKFSSLEASEMGCSFLYTRWILTAWSMAVFMRSEWK